MPRPIRSTRNMNVNYADFDLAYAADAEYDSDYTPPTEFRTATVTTVATVAPVAAPVAPVATRRSARLNTSRKSTDSSTSSHGYNTRLSSRM